MTTKVRPPKAAGYIKTKTYTALPVLRQVAVGTICALCAGTSILGGIYPLGVALLIAAGEKYAFSAAVGVIAACGVSMDITTATRYFAAVAVISMLKWSLGRPKEAKSFLVTAISGAGTLFLVGALYGAVTHSGAAAVAQDLAEGMIVLGLAVVDRLFIEAWEAGRRLQEMTREELAAGALVLAGVLASLTRFSPGGLNLGVAAASALLCTIAACRGERAAASAAVVCALAISVGAPQLCFAAVVLGAASMAGGLFFPGARSSVAVIFGACGFLGVFLAPDVFSAGLFFAAHLLGCALSLCLPAGLLTPLRALPEGAGEGGHLPARISGRLYDLSAALKQVGGTMEKVQKLTPQRKGGGEQIYQAAAEACCKQCKNCLECWVNRYQDTVEGLEKLTRTLGEKGAVSAEDLPGELQHSCTEPARLCGALNLCYHNQLEERAAAARSAHLRTVLQEQDGAVAGALDTLAGEVFREDMLDKKRTAKLSALFEELGLEPLEASVVVDRWGRVRASVHIRRLQLSAEQLDQLNTEVCRRCRADFERPQLEHRGSVSALLFYEKARYRPDCGLASSAARQDVCGDVARTFCDTRGNAHLLLCDGMGTGKAAAVDGTLSVALLKDLLSGGFAPDEAARLCTAALSLREDGESGSCMDLCSVNLYTGKLLLYKAGAAFSVIVRDGRAALYEGAGLPLGIAGARAGKSMGATLRGGDMAILVSDGVADTGSGWLLAEAQLRCDLPAQKIAHLLLEGARARSGEKADDLTVAVMKLDPVR